MTETTKIEALEEAAYELGQILEQVEDEADFIFGKIEDLTNTIQALKEQAAALRDILKS